MKCYLMAQQPLHSLNIYQAMIKVVVLNDKLIKILANLRMKCYSKLMQQIFDQEVMKSADIAKVKDYFKMIMQEIPYDVKLQSESECDNFYKYLDDKLLQQMLNTLIMMNENGYRLGMEYENEMLTFLENGFKNDRFGFWNASR